ncbi:hypothetical protein NQ314_000555 [Rhamnusium bicolor]|uniref:Uncharacterized protein n=1 Tax=Rhamnusium bicolor TaxID=1586634 RepID=A0AAV8ZUB9_9CUCU|nr:hypothetical protein NQ314_000555 [Rhamnusium bicolor]
MKLINNSDSDSEASEHELSYYLNDRVKLMKEVLKIIKPKRIKNMAPDCIKNIDNEDINSMLLEELLGISNKRVKRIFNGQNLEEDSSSSTDPEEEQQPIDIISLDDVNFSVTPILVNATSEKQGHKKHSKKKVKVEDHKRKKIKKEKQNKASKKSKEVDRDKTDDRENLMSVLELLELQARARAIKSQLALENSRKAQEKENNTVKVEESDHEDAVIIESPKNIEILITSSESETEDSRKHSEYNNQNTKKHTDKQDHSMRENNKENGENLNQAMTVGTDDNEDTLEDQAKEIEESRINDKDEIRSVSGNKSVELENQLSNNEQNKPECSEHIENREEISTVSGTEKEKIICNEQLERINVEIGESSEGKKSQAVKSSNTKENAITRDCTQSKYIFITDSESENDKTNRTKKRHRKCKKSKMKKTNDDIEGGDKKSRSIASNRDHKRKIPDINREPEVSGSSKNVDEANIANDTKKSQPR